MLTATQQQQLDYVRKLKERGAAMMTEQVKVSGEVPADLGLFGGSTFAPFEFGKAYELYDTFQFEGKPGYIKQAHTSGEQWVPFTAGTEALYGARPQMLPDGTFPYVYNMSASVGMKVWNEDKTALYECYQAIKDMLWPPDQIPAHFREVAE